MAEFLPNVNTWYDQVAREKEFDCFSLFRLKDLIKKHLRWTEMVL
jgi:hypothetical protein